MYYIKPELFELGRTVMKTPAGNEVPCYDLGRTICDCIRSRNKMGTETFFGCAENVCRKPEKGFEQAKHLRKTNTCGVTFEIGTISPIREDDINDGYRVILNTRFDTLLTPLRIDVSTGDAITPHGCWQR